MKILIAEDDRASRLMMTQIIGTAYETVLTENGAEAWIALQTNPDVALAIIDLNMPEMTGVQWLEQVRAHPQFSKLPVIVCTGDKDRATVAKVAALGISSYLVKPFTRTSVLEKISQVLHPRQAAAPVNSPLTDVAGVRDRLGVDRDAHRELLANHVRIVDIWLTDARRAARFPEVRALTIRLAHLHENSAALGAVALAARFKEAENLLTGFRTAPFTLAQLQACLKTVVAEAEKIQPEFARVRSFVDAMP